MWSISSLSRTESITLGAGEEIYEGTGRASSVDLDGIGEVGNRVNER